MSAPMRLGTRRETSFSSRACQVYGFDFRGPAHFGEQRLSSKCRGATQEHLECLGRVLPCGLSRWFMELSTFEQRADPNPHRSLALDATEK